MDEIKKFDDPGLVLMGFKPMDRLKLHHHIRPALFIYPEEEQISGRSSFAGVLSLNTSFSSIQLF